MGPYVPQVWCWLKVLGTLNKKTSPLALPPYSSPRSLYLPANKLLVRPLLKMYLKPIFNSGSQYCCFRQLSSLPLELAPISHMLKTIQPLKLPAQLHSNTLAWASDLPLLPVPPADTLTIMQPEWQSQPQSICSLSLLSQDVVHSWLQTGGIPNFLTILHFKRNTSTKKYDCSECSELYVLCTFSSSAGRMCLLILMPENNS